MPGVSLLRSVQSRVSSLRDALNDEQGFRGEGSCGDGRPRPSKRSEAPQALFHCANEVRVILSVVVIAHNEEANIGRTLASVRPLVADGKGEIIVVDSGSTDRTVEIAKSLGAKVFVEEWKGYAAQKNSAIEKATGDWILSLDADEEADEQLVQEISWLLDAIPTWQKEGMPVDNDLRSKELRDRGLEIGLDEDDLNGFFIPRKNYFLERWIRHGGFWPDSKLRFFRREAGKFQDQAVHETVKIQGTRSAVPHGALIHHSYPTLADYIDHMNRYSSLGAEMAAAKGRRGFSLFNIVVRPLATFICNYFFRLGFLDGREGLLLHLYHAVYVSWKYAKAWELARKMESS
ncbi:MAG: glycosyltransferase family 2 protein [Acidobacteriia bacterium]|nr:glycosyltransferase family 2 protein [Terriglobia bacterium]